jgi:hypothetical protein
VGQLTVNFLTVVVIFIAFSEIFVYHSAVLLLLSGFNLVTAICWYWISAIVAIGIKISWVSERSQTLSKSWRHYFWWLLVEILIVLAKVFVPEFTEVFLWVQYFQVISLILNLSSILASPQRLARNNFRWASAISGMTFTFSYFCLIELLLIGSTRVHARVWSFIALGIVLGFFANSDASNYDFIRISRSELCAWFSLWSFVEAAIILAKLHVPSWYMCFNLIQGSNTIAMAFLLLVSAFNFPDFVTFKFAKLFTTLGGLAAYHSIIAHTASGWTLFLLFIWPWIGAAILYKCVMKRGAFKN